MCPYVYDESSFLSFIAELFDSHKNAEVRAYWNGKLVEIEFNQQVSAWEDDLCFAYISVNGDTIGNICLSRPIDATPKTDGSDISINAHLHPSIESISDEGPLDVLSQYIAIFFPLPEDIKEPSE